jgi:hypothetical protein
VAPCLVRGRLVPPASNPADLDACWPPPPAQDGGGVLSSAAGTLMVLLL